MNILPVVLSLLMILGISAYAFTQGRAATLWEERAYIGFIKAERKFRSAWEKMAFLEAPKKPKEKNISASKEPAEASELSSESTYQSPREKESASDLAKLNIGPLLRKPAPAFRNRLYETAAKLIRELYADLPAFKNAAIKHPEYLILDGLIEKGLSDETLNTLVALFPEQDGIKTLFYIMLKGTNTYDLKTKKGIPPLTDFFFIDRSVDVKPIYFPFASVPLLKAVIGEKNTVEVLKKEYEKWEENHKHKPVSKAELEEIILANVQERIDLANLEDLINFSKSGYSSKTIAGDDKETGIWVRKHL